MKWIVVITLLLVLLGHAQIVEWIHRYNGPDNLSEWPYDITVDTSGNVYVCGFGYLTATYMDYLTIKYNSSGDTVWLRYYDGGQLFYDRAHAIAIDDSGNVYVTGLSIESGNQYDIATIKYNSAGVEQWVARYNGPGNDDDEAYDIAIDDSGYIYVCGYTRSAATFTDYITLKYDRYGDTVWTSTYNGPFNGIDIAYALALDDSGNVYVTGSGNSATYDNDYYTIKINAVGDTQWVVAYDGTAATAYDYANDIALGGGYIYVTGESDGAGTEADYATIKYSPAGDTLWEMRYNGPGNGDDNANGIVADSLGNVFVTGGSMGPVQTDYATIKYNFSGNVEWVSRYNGPDDDIDEAFDIVLDHMGNVYVAGQSYATQPYTPEFDFLTIKYNASGVEQWTHRYNGTGDSQDHLYDMAVDDAGNVYVTGSSIGNIGYDDIVTIKYGVTGINEEAGNAVCEIPFNLTASPNPFHYQTRIRFTIPDAGCMIEEANQGISGSVGGTSEYQKPGLTIYDATGRLVKQWNYPAMRISDHISWDGTDGYARKLPSGVYFVKLEIADYQETRQLLLIR